MITVTRSGVSFAEFSKIMNDELLKRENILEKELISLGTQATNFARTYINTHKRNQPGTGNLARAIDFEVDRADRYNFNVYVGDILKLDRLAPYWYIVNYGGRVTNYSDKTHFVQGRFYGKKFIAGGGKRYYKMPSGLKTTTNIRPMNYIEATDRFISKRASDVYGKI